MFLLNGLFISPRIHYSGVALFSSFLLTFEFFFLVSFPSPSPRIRPLQGNTFFQPLNHEHSESLNKSDTVQVLEDNGEVRIRFTSLPNLFQFYFNSSPSQLGKRSRMMFRNCWCKYQAYCPPKSRPELSNRRHPDREGPTILPQSWIRHSHH